MAISFKGAIKYARHNGFSASQTPSTPIPSTTHFFPLTQGKFKLEPKVSEGDRVIIGQKIADLAEFDTIPVISSISGLVTSVTPDFIRIENDMMFSKAAVAKPVKTADELTIREVLWLLREGCVYEPRYRTPLHVLLSDKKVSECIIVCCFDSDPYVSSPQTAASGNSEKILRALKTVMRISGITKTYIAVENDTKKTFSDFKLHLRYNPDIQPFIMKARYPQSRSDILINTVTGSTGTNALVLSAETLCNMTDVLETGFPVTKKIVTVSGDDILEPVNFLVPAGATVSSVIESGGYSSPELVINGGVIDGDVIADLDTPVTCDTKALIAFYDRKNVPKYRKKPI